MDPLLRGASGIPVPPKTVAVGIPADLVRRRPDIRAAELAAMAQSAQIGIAEANLYPAFSLTGAFGTSASSVGKSKLKRVFEGSGIGFAFGPSFRWNILNYGQITNEVRVEDAALLTCRGRFVDDLGVTAGTLHAAILRSPRLSTPTISPGRPNASAPSSGRWVSLSEPTSRSSASCHV